MLADIINTIQSTEKELEKPFSQEEELQNKLGRQAELLTILSEESSEEPQEKVEHNIEGTQSLRCAL